VSDRVALVTGGSRGIGRATAERLARDGMAVAINYASDIEGAKAALEAVHSSGGEGHIVQADVSDGAQVDAAFSEVEEVLGPIDVLVNNAGIRADGLCLSLSDEKWHEVIMTDLYGPFACTRRALRTMLPRRSGCIVNVSSIAGLRASPGQANYAAAKAGLIGLTKTVAAEVARKGITVNAVVPGFIDTALTGSLPERRVAELVTATPQQRSGEANEVASAIAWFCSPDARFITGSSLVIDGGLTA
jgi:3-oxoacyl-[acyl-carrier protein] reductase